MKKEEARMKAGPRKGEKFVDVDVENQTDGNREKKIFG